MKQIILHAHNQQQLRVFRTETVADRMRGLFAVDIRKVDGLWIQPCNSVHTFGMPYSLDLVYLDKRQNIIKVVHNLLPWRVSLALRAKSVVELHAGKAQALGLQVGHSLVQQ
jgi:uncharacterized membrane protein (UPF0127 family)